MGDSLGVVYPSSRVLLLCVCLYTLHTQNQCVPSSWYTLHTKPQCVPSSWYTLNNKTQCVPVSWYTYYYKPSVYQHPGTHPTKMSQCVPSSPYTLTSTATCTRFLVHTGENRQKCYKYQPSFVISTRLLSILMSKSPISPNAEFHSIPEDSPCAELVRTGSMSHQLCEAFLAWRDECIPHPVMIPSSSTLAPVGSMSDSTTTTTTTSKVSHCYYTSPTNNFGYACFFR